MTAKSGGVGRRAMLAGAAGAALARPHVAGAQAKALRVGIPTILPEMFALPPIEVMGGFMPGYYLFMLAVSLGAGLLLWLGINRTRTGKIIRALAAPIRTLTPGMELSVLIESFIVTVIGGMGSIAGAFIAAVLVGLIRSFGSIGLPLFVDGAMFGLMAPVLVVLVMRPSGLLGAARPRRRRELRAAHRDLLLLHHPRLPDVSPKRHSDLGRPHRRGPGMRGGIPRPPFPGIDLGQAPVLYAFCAVVFVACLLLMRQVSQSPFGYTLCLVRDNPARANFLGVHVARVKLGVFSSCSPAPWRA